MESIGEFSLSMSSTVKKRRRARAVQACERCRTKKYKCDELYPACSHCSKARVCCQYSRNIRNNGTAVDLGYVRALEERVEDLVAQLASLQTNTATASSTLTPSLMDKMTAAICQPSLPAAFTTTAASVHSTDGSIDTILDADAAAHNTNSPHSSEITDVNPHTKDIEFHGNTSSIAFLGDLERLSRNARQGYHRWTGTRRGSDSGLESRSGSGSGQDSSSTRPSLVSALHNGAFVPQLCRPLSNNASAAAALLARPKENNYYAAQAQIFIEAYFSGLHLIVPIIDKESFLARASMLWSGQKPAPSDSFVAMYLALLSFGALTRSWPEATLGGLTRFEWSRKLFNEAMAYMYQLQFSNDIESVYCLFLMAKICKNELTPHLAWLFYGRVVRTCISAGFNRNNTQHDPKLAQELSRVWWGVFSQEVEMSFSLGRPDTIGHNAYHNRPLPDRDQSEHAIIPCMVDFALIVRKVSLFYATKPTLCIPDTTYALQLEAELDAWLHGLPAHLRPRAKAPLGGGGGGGGSLREPEWCRRQRRVLELRYHNVRLGLFRGFINLYAHSLQTGDGRDCLFECAQKCIASARCSIENTYETYRDHVYFRTWWYNTTYIMMAAAAVLSYIQRVRRVAKLNRGKSETTAGAGTGAGAEVGAAAARGPALPTPTPTLAELVHLVEMAAEILDAMDESVVARKCAEIVRWHLREVENTGGEGSHGNTGGNVSSTSGNTAENPIPASHDSMPEIAHSEQGAVIYLPVAGTGYHSGDGSTLPLGTASLDAGTPFTGYEILDYSFEDMASLFEGLNDTSLF